VGEKLVFRTHHARGPRVVNVGGRKSGATNGTSTTSSCAFAPRASSVELSTATNHAAYFSLCASGYPGEVHGDGDRVAPVKFRKLPLATTGYAADPVLAFITLVGVISGRACE
jgi:hypothetical protein